MIVRATFANITPEALAERVQSSGFSGTVFASIGASDWGVEASATVEFAVKLDDIARVVSFIRDTLQALSEQAAYVTFNGDEALLIWQAGKVERL